MIAVPPPELAPSPPPAMAAMVPSVTTVAVARPDSISTVSSGFVA